MQTRVHRATQQTRNCLNQMCHMRTQRSGHCTISQFTCWHDLPRVKGRSQHLFCERHHKDASRMLHSGQVAAQQTTQGNRGDEGRDQGLVRAHICSSTAWPLLVARQAPAQLLVQTHLKECAAVPPYLDAQASCRTLGTRAVAGTCRTHIC